MFMRKIFYQIWVIILILENLTILNENEENVVRFILKPYDNFIVLMDAIVEN